MSAPTGKAAADRAAGIGHELGKVPCSACGFDRARVKTARNGTLTIACSECGTSAFVKSPAAVAKLRARIGATAAEAPASANDSAGGLFGWLTSGGN